MLAADNNARPQRFQLVRRAVSDTLHLQRQLFPRLKHALRLRKPVDACKQSMTAHIIQFLRLSVLDSYARLPHERSLLCFLFLFVKEQFTPGTPLSFAQNPGRGGRSNQDLSLRRLSRQMSHWSESRFSDVPKWHASPEPTVK